MFQEMPSRPVLALVIPAVSSCIDPALPCFFCWSAFNHVSSGFETIPNGTRSSFSAQRKRGSHPQATQGGTRFFAPCHPLCAALSLNRLSLERIQSVLGDLGAFGAGGGHRKRRRIGP